MKKLLLFLLLAAPGLALASTPTATPSATPTNTPSPTQTMTPFISAPTPLITVQPSLGMNMIFQGNGINTDGGQDVYVNYGPTTSYTNLAVGGWYGGTSFYCLIPGPPPLHSQPVIYTAQGIITGPDMYLSATMTGTITQTSTPSPTVTPTYTATPNFSPTASPTP